MATYRLGSKGEEVLRIQTRLQKLGFYDGRLDSDFGGGTHSAVRAFQKKNGLDIDGVVGSDTWKALFKKKTVPTPKAHAESLAHRCLSLTGTFETGKGPPECFAGVTGDFDGQGISFGALQWNFGQNSLQPILEEMHKKHVRTLKDTFQESFPVLEALIEEDDKEGWMNFARSIQDPVRHFIHEPWRGRFRALGRTSTCQKLQVNQAKNLFQKALEYCEDYDLWSERAMALMFDIKVQNGSISRSVRAQILSEFESLPDDLDEETLEEKKLEIVAHRRAEASNPRWVEDVRRRKLCIAQGEGRVHGIDFLVEDQFGIALKPY